MPSVRQPANDRVIGYLQKLRGSAAEDEPAPLPGSPNYWEAGAHPDVVERIWEQLGRMFPPESRRVVCGTPALVNPDSKVLIAVGIGTAYAIRLPSSALLAGVPPTVRTEIVWTGGARFNVQTEFGSDWAAGSYMPEEVTWCRQAFDEHAAEARG